MRCRRSPWWMTLVIGVLVVLQSWLPAQAVTGRTRALLFEPNARLIPIEQQPFYGELVRDAGSWSDVVLGQVVGSSPRATLLNFYAVMAEVGDRADRLGRYSALVEARRDGEDRQEQIDDTNLLFDLAVRALDASVFPQSVRGGMADEAAIQLKHVLDYVFTHSVEPISIPDSAGMKALNDQRTKPVDAWRIPGTAITLTSDLVGDPENNLYVFSADTVRQIHAKYEEIRDYPPIRQPFATPHFYHDFILTPGYLVPPDWYLRFPRSWRSVFEIPVLDKTLFQVVCAIAVISIYLLAAGWLIRLLVDSYRDRPLGDSLPAKPGPWVQDGIAWRRFFFILPVLPLTRLAEYLIDDEVNFTGLPLVVVTYAFYVIWFVTAGLVVFLFFEALGRTGSEFLTRVRGSGSEWRLQRVSSFLMPLCRALGGLIAVAIFYRLLILLGLPASTVLAFSAVPGLAIGLGASKLLGNLFAGLSIQTDRPLRVGEFCRVGDSLGYITKIGLRSLELQTLESRVTIPNSIADEATIVNYSRRSHRPDRRPMQSLELRLDLDGAFSPYQLEEVLHQTRRSLEARQDLHQPLVTLERSADGAAQSLVVVAMVELHGWPAYLRLRDHLLLQLEELIERAQLSEIALGIAYGTTPEQLQRVPALMQKAVEVDSELRFLACRLERIAAFSYDHVLEFSSLHSEHDAFEDSLHELNRRIIETLAAEGIEIPFPTQTLMLNPSDAAHP
jgi:MscS family membrane protein